MLHASLLFVFMLIDCNHPKVQNVYPHFTERLNITFMFTSYIPKEIQNTIQKDIGTPVFIAALFTIARPWN